MKLTNRACTLTGLVLLAVLGFMCGLAFGDPPKTALDAWGSGDSIYLDSSGVLYCSGVVASGTVTATTSVASPGMTLSGDLTLASGEYIDNDTAKTVKIVANDTVTGGSNLVTVSIQSANATNNMADNQTAILQLLYGNDDCSATTTAAQVYADLLTTATDVSTATEDATVAVRAVTAGSLVTAGTFSGAGLALGSGLDLTCDGITSSGTVSLAAGQIDVSELSAAAKIKSCVIALGDVSATDNDFIFVAPSAAVISQISLVTESSPTGLTQNAATNWTFQVANLTLGSNLLAQTVSTVTNGFTANTVYDLTPDQNLTLTANDVLQLQATLTGGAGTLTNSSVIVEWY